MVVPLRFGAARIHREIGVGHLAFNEFSYFQSIDSRRIKIEAVLRLIKRIKIWKTLNMIPVKMGQKNRSSNAGARKFAGQAPPKAYKSAPAIQNNKRAVGQPDFHTWRVTAVA